jgi:Holliday junction resolvase-like predicted endonuclease
MLLKQWFTDLRMMTAKTAKTDNYLKGKIGEETALKLLRDKGYELITKNYKNNFGEIDLIMRKDRWLVFVEVKLKNENTKGVPEEMINNNKIGRIRRAAIWFLKENQSVAVLCQQYRIDAVCITIKMGGNLIKHYENIGT